MASRKITRNKRKEAEDNGTAMGTVALVASILGNLKQHSDAETLRRNMAALQQLVQDWQFAYQSLDEQLTLALRSNDELNRQVVLLRAELRRSQERLAEAERRLLARKQPATTP